MNGLTVGAVLPQAMSMDIAALHFENFILYKQPGNIRLCERLVRMPSGNIRSAVKLPAVVTAAQAGKLLDQQRQIYETILSSVTDLVYMFDLNHRFTYANPALLSMWGKTWEEAIGKNCLELGYEPWHAEMHDREIEEVVKTKQPIKGEVPFNGAQGRRIYEYIFVPIIGEHGNVEAIAGTTRDVTERKNIEEALRASESKYREQVALQTKTDNVMRHLANIVESSDDAIISKNLRSIITSWNRGAERIFGYTAQEMIGQSILKLIPENLHTEEPIILDKLQRGERVNHFQTIRRCKDGRFIDVSLTVSPIFDASGTVIGASKIARDITEQKKTQESLALINAELKDLTMNLERRVSERTARLEEQSEQLRKLAIELTGAEEKERKRLAQVLHDHLQQLLVAARMRLDIIERKEVEIKDKSGFNDLRKYIEEAFNSSRSLTAELRPPVLYEGGLIPAIKFLARRYKEQYHFTVHFTAQDNVEPASNFLKTMLYSTLQEIIFNAVKYSGVKECVIEMKRVSATQAIHISVKDNGVGFDADSIGRPHAGGFGLFSIRERMRALGGEFTIISAAGQGTAFIISIPDQKDDAQVFIEQVEHQMDMASARNPKNGLSVLLADDHTILRQSLANVLKSQPFIGDVMEAVDGIDVIDKARLSPDVIIMDVNMPRLNGIEATKIIHQKYPGIKIVGLSVQVELETQQAMRDCGAIGYFHKGEDTDVLIEALRNYAIQLKT